MKKQEDLKRVLICGGRDLNEVKAYQVIGKILAGRQVVIIQGDAKGADKGAKRYAQQNRLPLESYPADWDQYGNAAGPIRNKQMLEEGKPDIVIALPGGTGTANMIEQAEKAGIRVKKISQQDFDVYCGDFVNPVPKLNGKVKRKLHPDWK